MTHLAPDATAPRRRTRGLRGSLAALHAALAARLEPPCPRCRRRGARHIEPAVAAELGAPLLYRRCGWCGHGWPEPLDPAAWLA
jgi:hypothetical protein